MTFIPGQFVVTDAPGAIRGLCNVNSPGLYQAHLRGVPLASGVIDAVTSGTLTIYNGTVIAPDATGAFKVVGASNTATGITLASTVGGVYLALLNSDAPTVFNSGKISILDYPFAEYTTDQVDLATAPVAGHFVTIGAGGKLLDSGSASKATTSIGRITAVQANLPNSSGGFSTSITVRLLGSAYVNAV